VNALHGLDFTVDAGQRVAILGPNGAGKTTILRALTGMVDTSGRIDFDGESIAREKTDKIARRGIAHVPEGRGTFAELTVEENLRVGAYTRKASEVGDDLQRCFEYFPRLEERRSQEAGSLSGGEQQMLAISRALMLRPRLLLIDEPSLGLAPLVTRELFDVLRRISEESEMGLLVVEQNAALALAAVDYAYVLESGEIALSGPADEIAGDESVKRSYLGV
jgi:branched-chain amino acid transport system ATP-binding protein